MHKVLYDEVTEKPRRVRGKGKKLLGPVRELGCPSWRGNLPGG